MAKVTILIEPKRGIGKYLDRKRCSKIECITIPYSESQNITNALMSYKKCKIVGTLNEQLYPLLFLHITAKFNEKHVNLSTILNCYFDLKVK